MNWTEIYGVVFILSLGLSLILTPCCQRLAQVTGFLDIPKCEKHKLHEHATPLLGGLAMFSAWVLTMLISFLAMQYLYPALSAKRLLEGLSGVANVSGELLVLALCAFAALALGTFDDKFALKAWQKLIGQIIISVVAVTFGGLRITLFVNCPPLSWGLTVFWLIFIFNSINFFDNMDGLAAGTATIAFLFFTTAAIFNGQYFVACLGACSAGATMGFWFFNHSPASIFMGDGGSHFLAFLLGLVSCKVTYYNPAVASSRLSIFIPVFILALPIFDTFMVVLIRLKNHKPIYVGDHNHISHRFLRMGMTRKRAVLSVHILGIIAGLCAMPLLWGDSKSCLILFIQGCAILLLMTILQYSAGGNPESRQ